MFTRRRSKGISLLIITAVVLSILLMQTGLALAASLHAPTIYPNGGTYTTARSVTIGNIRSGDTAYYTIDGSNPTTSSTAVAYSGAFTVDRSETVRAAVYDLVLGWSSMTSATFRIINANTLQAPTIYPYGGTYTTARSVTIGNIPSGDTAYYTIDGSNPTTSSTAVTYSGAFTVDQSETVKAAVQDSAGNWSSVTSATFYINNANTLQAPTIYPYGGTYTTARSVTIGNIPSGDTAYYTIDGSNPTTSSTAVTYSGAFTVDQSETVKAAVQDSAGNWSSVTSATFYINDNTDGDQLTQLKQEFADAVNSNKMTLAMQILQQIKQLTSQNQNENLLNDLKQQLIDAVNNDQYQKAEQILLKILKLEHSTWAYQQLGKIYQEEGKDQDPSVFFNGCNVQFNDVQPQIIDNRCMIPIRSLAVTLGVDNNAITWSQDGTVNIQYGKDRLRLHKNQNVIYKNDVATTIDVSPQIVNGRMLIPLRAVSQLMNKKVDWYQSGKIVSIE